MAKSFKDTQGKAQSNASYKMKDGENVLRFVGDILPRYGYWIRHKGKNKFFECLSFDREEEAFLRKEHDPVRDHFPDMKCAWSYVMYAFDESLDEPKLVRVDMKKKLFEQIQNAAEDLGDPTDPETGWKAIFKKAKNGPNAFNVEYTLNVLRSSKEIKPLTEAQKKILAEAPSLDKLIPRPTAESLARELEDFLAGEDEDSTEGGNSELPEGMGGETANDL